MIMATIEWTCKQCGEQETSVHQDNGDPFVPEDTLYVYCSECGTEYSTSPYGEGVELTEE